MLAALAMPAHAAHPVPTEDTGMEGTGHFELELGFADARDGATSAFEFGPQLSYGALEKPT